MPENKAHQRGRRATPVHAFQPGQSGNPGGRPRAMREVVLAAREYTMQALDVLAAIMLDKCAPTAARVAAADRLLDRGWGRAPQTITIDDTRETDERLSADGNGNVIRYSQADLEAVVRKMAELE